VLSADDFAAYRPVIREPIVTTYRGLTIVGFPPPSSGGVHVAQILNILEYFDLANLHDENPALVDHVTAEAMKLAFADRAYWLGDADFVKVPHGLIDKAYARELASSIDLAKAQVVKGHGNPPHATSDFFRQRHTTHIAAADAEGNWVAITATINTTFGSKVIVPGTGVVLNNEMDDFAIHAGVPNVFGLVGGEANAVEPGKRPLSSMCPTIVLKEGRPVLTVGAAGGPTIISQVVLAIVRHADLGTNVDEAVAAPRLHHQWVPDRVLIEGDFSSEAETLLTKRGHKVQRTRDLGVTQAIWVGGDGRRLFGLADPRVAGKSGGF
jgi:gamma-glutamyltranspeptidase/glutathione hydrolase